MSNEINVPNAFMTILTGGGLIAVVNEYQVVLSIGIAAAGLVIGLVFNLLSIIHRNKIEKRKSVEYREKIKQEVLKEINDLNKLGEG